MKKNARTLIILSAVLVVIIGAYITVTLINANKAKNAAAEAEVMTIYPAGWDTPAIISYDADGSSLSFSLEDSQWVYDGDQTFPLKQSSLTGLSSALTALTPVRTFEAADDLSAYGLDTPTYSVTATDSVGNELTLLIGSMNGDNYYAMKSGGSEVYTIDAASLIGKLESDILNMITLDTVPTLSETTIDTITLSDGTQTLTLDKYQERDGTYTWFVVEGETYTSTDDYVLTDGTKGSAVYLTNILTALSGMSFSSCAAYNPPADTLGSYGLDNPSLTVTVNYTTTDTSGTETSGSAVIEIGTALDDESGYYAMLPDSGQVNVLSASKAEPLISALNAMGLAA